MFWNDPSMYGATLAKDYGKELYPKEFGYTPYPFMGQSIPPWMNQRFHAPFYGFPVQNQGFTPGYTPWLNPVMHNPYLAHFGFKPFGHGYEIPFNAYRNMPW